MINIEVDYNDYDSLLDRAMEKMPELETTDERFSIPEPKIFQEGKTTVLDNFGNIVDALNRDPEHVLKYLNRELGTAGKIEGNRAIFQGRFPKELIKSNLDSYLNEYVLCSECGRPDTQLEKVDRVLVMKCLACGAHRPIRKKKASTGSTQAPTVEEGKVYDVQITAVGSKGDGIAKLDKFTVFVPGAAKGQELKVKINRISGNLAFAEKAE